MHAARTLFIRFFRHWPALTLAALVAAILIHEAPRGTADFEPLSLHPYAQPAQAEQGFAAVSHPPVPTPSADA